MSERKFVECTDPSAPMARYGAAVLLVEDNIVNQKVARRFLERLGCEVTLAVDGAEGVQKFAGGSFDLIVMDLHMPRMNGLVATESIRRMEAEEVRGQHIPIVALTANAVKGQRERCMAAGMDDFLTKPLDAAHLRRVLERFVDARPTVDAPGSDKIMSQRPIDETLTDVAALDLLVAGAAQSSQVSAVDFARLEEITDRDLEFTRELTDIYIASSTQILTSMRASIASSDRETLRKAAHQLAGASANIHAVQAHGLCKALEAAAGSPGVALSAESVEQVAAEVARCTTALQEYMGTTRFAA